MDMLREAHSGRIPVEGRVETINKGGFEISLGDKKAFCPISQIDLDFVEDPNKYLGANHHFLITQIDPKGRNIIVSRAQLMREERAAAARETMARIAPGDVLTGEVRRIADYGIFVDIGGVDGMVHISQLSWDRVTHPSEIVKQGDRVRVKILQIDPGNERISLSMREAEENPWDTHVGNSINEGDTFHGDVMRLESFGAFVRLKPGIEGLVHLSEMRWGQRVNHPSDIMKTGDTILVKVIGIDREKHRISLSLKQMEDDPWTLMAPDLQEGKVLSATVTSIKPTGLEVIVENSLRGFVPGSKSGVGQGENVRTVFKENQPIQVRVIEADTKTRRLILEVVDLDAEQQKTDVQQYMAEARPDSKAGFGSLGSKLQKAMEKKQQQS